MAISLNIVETFVAGQVITPWKSSKTIDIVSYALEVSVSGVVCVFVFHVRSSDTF